MQPRTQYAKSGDVHIAYQVFGEGVVDLIFIPGFISHIENYWDEPNFARWLRRLGSFSRVMIFDKRGTGLSDQVSELLGMDQRMDDVRAVMDTVGIERAAIFGISEGGSLATLFAATHPERSEALIVYGGYAKFSSWISTQEALDSLIQYIDTKWGSGEGWLDIVAPTMENDLAFRQWWGKFERLGASPSAAIKLINMNSQIDITEILPSINVPTLVIHRKDDKVVDVEGGRLLAKMIPGAKYLELSGADHLPFVGENSDRILDEMEHFLTGESSTANVERMLATVVFTDIVDSTAKAQELGDRAWGDLQDLHDKTVRKELERFRGNEVKWTGDGFLAAFDRPARAIKCALTIVNSVKPLGIEVRVGIHTGEVDLIKNDVRGIAVNIASRVADLANGGDVVVSRTVKDLVAGSGIAFEDYGNHELKGVPDQWELFRVIS